MPIVTTFDAADKEAMRLADLSVVQRLKVEGAPLSLALTGVSGAQH